MSDKDEKDFYAPMNINGVEYYTVQQFANLTNRSEGCIRRLIARGNKLRKLKAIRYLDRPLIPVSELKEFPFTVSGTSTEVMYYGE